MKLIVIFAMLLACEPRAMKWDTPAPLRADGPPGWGEKVKWAAAVWNRSLYNYCGKPVFYLSGDDAHPVVLISEAKWDGIQSSVGYEDENKVAVRGTMGDLVWSTWGRPILLHELGHALGLDHTNKKDSVMYPTPIAGSPSDSDVESAAIMIGCINSW